MTPADIAMTLGVKASAVLKALEPDDVTLNQVLSGAQVDRVRFWLNQLGNDGVNSHMKSAKQTKTVDIDDIVSWYFTKMIDEPAEGVDISNMQWFYDPAKGKVVFLFDEAKPRVTVR